LKVFVLLDEIQQQTEFVPVVRRVLGGNAHVEFVASPAKADKQIVNGDRYERIVEARRKWDAFIRNPVTMMFNEEKWQRVMNVLLQLSLTALARRLSIHPNRRPKIGDKRNLTSSRGGRMT
jgi:hypothetical protein